ncbi:MAG: hypothetical protein ACLT3H_08560 [Roseburia sp.]
MAEDIAERDRCPGWIGANENYGKSKNKDTTLENLKYCNKVYRIENHRMQKIGDDMGEIT